MDKNRKNSIIIILVTNAILISLLDFFITAPIPIPGVKLGLANVITLLGIYYLDFRSIMNIVIIRCVVVALLTRGVMTIAFSLTAGLLSALIMMVLCKKLADLFSIKGISIAGAIVHNTTQILVASLILGQTVIFYYLPVLLVAAVVTGYITGSIGEMVIREIENKGVFANG